MGISPSRDYYKPHFERKQPDDNFHFASWGKIYKKISTFGNIGMQVLGKNAKSHEFHE
jgi:hypothetical protein